MMDASAGLFQKMLRRFPQMEDAGIVLQVFTPGFVDF